MNRAEDFVPILGAKRPALPCILKCAEAQREVSMSPEIALASTGLGEEGAELHSSGESEPAERT